MTSPAKTRVRKPKSPPPQADAVQTVAATQAVPATQTASPKGKLGALTKLLRASQGATLEAMMSATGWQAHSVRGALSGSLKKKLGLAIVSEKTASGRVYRIVTAPAA